MSKVEKYTDGAYYAKCCVSFLEGDTYFLDELHKSLLEDGFVDEYGEWIEDEETTN